MSSEPLADQTGALDGFVLETIERYRAKLLDLSSRNPLVDFRHSDRSRSHIRIVDEIPEILFSKLTAGRSLTFVPVPEPELVPEDERTPVFEVAVRRAKKEDEKYQKDMNVLGPIPSPRQKRKIERQLRNRLRPQFGLPQFDAAKDPRRRAAELGIATEYELPRSNGQKARHFNDLRIQTLFFHDELNRKLGALRDSARVLLHDAGLNALYCAFGFLEYYETSASEERRIAPLVFYPVELDRELEDGEYRYFIRPTDAEIEVNVALAELLRQQLSLELPSWKEAEDSENQLEEYLAAVEASVSNRPDWKLRRYVTVGLFTFSTLAMYKDLDPERWPEEAPIVKHPIVRTLIAGQETHGTTIAEDYDIDRLDGPDALLVTDADSSQHSAVIDVLQGKSCVIQGPPGTGKSQTITNIISALLHAGKSVLFVAEKMAALEVVQKRLRAAGLERFCLEVHSTKTSRTMALGSLSTRLEYRGPRPQQERLHSTIEELKRAREALIFYLQKTSERAGRTGLTIHDVLAGCAMREAGRGQIPSALANARLREALEITHHEYNAMLAAASSLESQMEPLSTFGKLADHPWRGLRNCDLTEFEADELFSRLGRWVNALQGVAEASGAIASQTSVTLPESLAQLGRLCSEVGALAEPTGDFVEDVFRHLSTRENRAHLSSAISRLQVIADNETALGKYVSDPRALTALGSGLLREAINILSKLGIDEGSLDDLRAKLSVWRSAPENVRRGQAAAQSLAGTLNLSDSSLGSLRAAATGIALLRELRSELWHMRAPAALDAQHSQTLREFEEKRADLLARRNQLSSRVDLSALPRADVLRQYAFALKTTSFVVAQFSRDCRNARRLFRLASVAGLKVPKRLRLAEAPLRWAEFLKQAEEFGSDRKLQQVCGPCFQGLDSPLPLLIELNEWAARCRQRLATAGNAGTEVRQVLFSGGADQLELLLAVAETPSFGALSSLLDAFSDNGPSLDDIGAREERRCQCLEKCLSELGSSKARGSMRVTDLPAVIDLVDGVGAQIHSMEGDDALQQLLPDTPRKSLERIEALRATAEHAERIAGANLPSELKQWLYPSFDRLSRLRELTGRLGSALTVEENGRASFNELARLEPLLWTGSASLDSAPLQTLVSKCDLAAANSSALRDYMNFLLTEEDAKEKGLGPVLDAYVQAGEDYADIAKATDLVFYRTAAEQILIAEPKLKRHSGSTHEQLRRKYQDLDREYIQLRRKLLAAELVRRPVPYGVAVGRVGDLTERALVERYAGQTRPRIALRDLFRRAGRAIIALKPCWMMSPLSVAQFLQPGAVQFDAVVMDEASQIRPEEALGAILRGGQLVVVGDQMQLPPTPFFQKLSNDGTAQTADDDFQDERQESVLETAAAHFHPPRRLKWHYRSEHGSLITFSNEEFYNNDLTVFPSPHHDDPSYGVKLVPVAGVYGSGLNRQEAERVVQDATSFMGQYPDRSLGIVAVNKQQADLIREEMDRVFAADPRTEAYRAKWAKEEGLESFFVKNLENVQGDERDVIFISTVYGPDETGSFYQRFGPINSEYGHRRLNVLFTRAKKQVVVFSSMSPEDILDEGKKRGVRVLKEYLRYARTGHWTPPEGARGGDETDSEFERWVLDLLRTHGFEAVPQLGYAGYWIDIAVRHPRHPGMFMCGIECDGASYHSGRSVRERDRLRQEILERHGWDIYRIWSTDWFRNPELQMRRLIAHLNARSREDSSL